MIEYPKAQGSLVQALGNRSKSHSTPCTSPTPFFTLLSSASCASQSIHLQGSERPLHLALCPIVAVIARYAADSFPAPRL